MGAVLLLAVFATYQPVWFAGYVWDDDGRLTANPCIVGPLGLKEIWTTSAADLCPLVYTTFWFEHALWGLAPLPYHLVNVLLQGGCAVLLWRVLRSLQVPGAWLGAALWALHPVQVDSVAWITEMKNTQSGLFFLLTILFYIRMLRVQAAVNPREGMWNYGLTLLFAALAMASKSSTIVLPLVLGLCAWWVEGRWHWRNLRRLGPIALLTVLPSLVTLWTQAIMGATLTDPLYARSLPERIAAAGEVIWFYLGKLIWPHPLIFIYPRWRVDPGVWLSWLPLAAVVLVLLILWRYRESWSRPYFFAFAYFLGALLPVLGLIDGFYWRYSLVADHMQYLASMGPLALVGAGISKGLHIYCSNRPRIQLACYFGLLFVPAFLSWQRAWSFRDADTLWADTLSQDPNCWLALTNEGVALRQQGKLDKARDYFQRVFAVGPHDAVTYANLGDSFMDFGDARSARDAYQNAIRLEPGHADYHYKLAIALEAGGERDSAVAEFQAALNIDPDHKLARSGRAEALKLLRQLESAEAQYEKVLTTNPKNADLRTNLGLILLQEGRIDEAIVQFEKAQEIAPNSAGSYLNLGAAFKIKGDIDAAIAQFHKALKIDPHSAPAHNDLGNALLQEGRVPEAISEYQIALQLQPDYPTAKVNLARAQSTMQKTAGGP